MDRSQEQDTVRACQAGELEEFGRLYDAYSRKIYDFIYYKTHHKETAEDLTSKTFMKVLEKITLFDCGKGHFSSWLYEIARNTIIDFYRTKKGDIGIDDVWDLPVNDDLARDIDIRDRLASVEQYLKKLSSEQREIVILRVWQGLPYKEIAEITRRSVPSCKMMFSRTMRELRKEMPLSLYLSLFLLNIS